MRLLVIYICSYTIIQAWSKYVSKVIFMNRYLLNLSERNKICNSGQILIIINLLTSSH